MFLAFDVTYCVGSADRQMWMGALKIRFPDHGMERCQKPPGARYDSSEQI